MNGGWTPDELLIEHGAFLKRIVRSLLRCDDLAEDIVQETVLARVPPAIREPGRMRGWLAGIARHKAISLQRSVQRRRRREQLVARSEETPSHETSIEQLELQRVLIETVQSLPGPIRSTLVLHYLEELTTAEIAERHEVSLEKVRWRIRRGLALVRDRLDRERHDWRVALLPIAFPGFRTAASRAAHGTHATQKPRMRLRSRRAFHVWGSVAILGVAWMLWEGFRANSLPSLGQEQLGEATSDTGTGSLMAHAGPASTEAVPVLEASADHPNEPAADTSAPTEGRLVLDLRCGDDPVADVDVWVIRDEEILLETRADAEGRLMATAFGGEGALYVHGPARGPEVVKVSLEPGQRQVPLDACSEVSGRLIFEEAPRVFPKTIELESDQLWKAHFDLPGPVRARASVTDRIDLTIPHETPSRLEASIRADGTFSFTGLPSDWEACLAIPEGLRLLQDHDYCYASHVFLNAPRENLLVRVAPNPYLWGIVTDQAGGKLSTHARVGVSLECRCNDCPWKSGEDHFFDIARTDGLGAFYTGEIGFDQHQHGFHPIHLLGSVDTERHNIDVTIYSPAGSRLFQVPPNSVSSDGYLGKFDLGAAREVQFVVRDAAGNPLKGASVKVLDATPGAEVLADSLGIGTLTTLSSERCEATFSAPGFFKRTVIMESLPTDDLQRKIVELERTTLLQVTFLTAGEDTLPRPFRMTALLRSDTGKHIGLARGDWVQERYAATIVDFDAQHGIVLSEIPTDLPLEILVISTSDGTVLDEFSCSAFKRSEHRILTRQVSLSNPRTLELLISDSTDVPLANLDGWLVPSRIVEMELADPRLAVTDYFGTPCAAPFRSDSLGRVVVGPLFSNRYVIKSEGFAPRELELGSTILKGGALHLRMQRAKK